MSEETEARMQRIYGVRVEDLRGEHPLTTENLSVLAPPDQPKMTGLTLVATYSDGDVHVVHLTPEDDEARIEVEISPHEVPPEDPHDYRLAYNRRHDGYDIRVKGAGKAQFR